MLFKRLLERLFYITFIFVPCTLAIVMAANYIAKFHASDYMTNIILFSILVLCSIFLMFHLTVKSGLASEIAVVAFLTLCAFLYRLLIVDYANAVPETDFRLAYENAKLWAEEGYCAVPRYIQYPYWGLWAYVISCVFRITGNTSLHTAQMINIYLGTLILPLIYLTVRNTFYEIKDSFPYKKISFVSAIIYCFWPGISLYCGVLTNEFITSFWAAIAILLLTISHKRKVQGKSFKKIYPLYLCAGISLGIMNCFKSIASIILIAWIISLFFCEILPYIIGKKWTRKDVPTFLISILSVIFLQFAVSQAGVYFLANVMGVSKAEMNPSVVWRTIYVGLNVEDNGKLGENSRALSAEIGQYPVNKQNELWKEAALKSIPENYRQYPSLFLKKFDEEWGSEKSFITHGFRRSLDLSDEEAEYYNNVMRYNRLPLYNTFTIYYIMVLLFCILSAIFAIRYYNLYAIFICSLSIFGFTLVELLMEAQNRYKSVFYFAFAVLTGPGIYIIFKMLKKSVNIFFKIFSKSTVRTRRKSQ